MAVGLFYGMLLIGVTAGAGLFIYNRNLDFAERCLFGLCPIIVPLCICGLVNKLCEIPFFYWSDPRLATLFAWWNGYPLYPGAGEAVNSNNYGPLAALVYFPATLAHSPTMAFMLSGAVAIILTCGPAIWLALRGGNGQRGAYVFNMLLVCIFIEFAFNNDALAYSMFNIHADAPALGFGAMACGILLDYSESNQRGVFLLTALFAAMSVWSKQSQAPLFVALPLFVLITRGWRTTLVFAACLLGVGLIVSAAMVLSFRPFSGLYFYMFVSLARVPWTIPSFAESMAIMLRILTLSLFPLLACATVLIPGFFHPAGARSIRRFVASNGWLLFVLLALLNLPMTYFSLLKIGVDVNNVSLVVYFLALGALLAIKQTLQSVDYENFRLGLKIGLVVFCVDCCSIQFRNSYLSFTRALSIWRNPSQLFFEYTKAHPGELYCPRSPLVSLLAEGRVYHFENGVDDRALVRMPMTESEFRKNVPTSIKYIAYPLSGRHTTLKFMPEFSEYITLPALPNCEVYKRGQPSNNP